MQKKFSFIVHTIVTLLPNDPAHGIYLNILEHLMKINYDETVKYINSIETEDDMVLVSNLFPYISYHFQRRDFLEVINNKLPEFRESKGFNFISQEIKEASKVLDEDN